jgi:hypothetical protein
MAAADTAAALAHQEGHEDRRTGEMLQSDGIFVRDS